MKSTLTALLLAFSIAGSGYEAAIAYFQRERSVAISSPDRQNYFVVDSDVWKFARADLAMILACTADGESAMASQGLE